MTTNIIIKQFVERYRSELRSGAFAYYKTIYNISLNDEARGRDYGVTNCLSDFVSEHSASTAKCLPLSRDGRSTRRARLVSVAADR